MKQTINETDETKFGTIPYERDTIRIVEHIPQYNEDLSFVEEMVDNNNIEEQSCDIIDQDQINNGYTPIELAPSPTHEMTNHSRDFDENHLTQIAQ